YVDAGTGGGATGLPGIASEPTALTLRVESPYVPSMTLLRLRAAPQQQRDRLVDRQPFVADALHRIGERHLDVVTFRKREHRLARGDALGDVATRGRQRRLHGAAPAEPLAERTVA